jgi:hypothetical protein
MAMPPNNNANDESDAKKNRRKVGFFYIWGNRLYGLYSLIFSKVGAGIAVLAIAGGGTLAVLKPNILSNLENYIFNDRVKVETKKWADSSVVFTVDGVDKAGRKATFDVVVLNKEYVWQRGSDVQLMRGDKPLSPIELDEQVFRPDVRTGFGKASELIAVGVASQEGGAASESVRAGKRAETGASWIKTAMGPSAKVSTLNLGQYLSTCVTPDVGDTSWQRPFMMVAVRAAQPDVNLQEALTNAFTGKSNLPTPECYSQFQLTRAT